MATLPYFSFACLQDAFFKKGHLIQAPYKSFLEKTTDRNASNN